MEVLSVVPVLLVVTDESFVFVDEVVVALVELVVAVEVVAPETKQEHAEEIRT